jgi:membrane associated rhomboid family serine protease
MLIPVGQENSTVRRDPWVSYAIIALNLLVAIPIFFAAPDRAATVRARAGRVYEYIAHHPYLEMPAGLVPLWDEEFLEQLRQARAEYESEGALPEPDVLAREQQELDALAEQLLAARRDTPYNALGYVPASPRPWTAVTSMFVHGGWLHLLGNMLFFFLTGPFIEDAFGRPLFALLYLFSGFAALFTHALHFPDSTAPLVGASGAIAGIMGAFLVRLGAARIRFLFFPFFILPFVRISFTLPAFVVLPAWFLEQHWSATHAQGNEGVAFWAHVGGFVFGAAAAGIMRVARIEERIVDPAIEKQVAIVQHPSLEKAIDARLAGNVDTARREVRRALAERPDDVDAWAESCEIALAADDPAEIDRGAARLLDLYARTGETQLGFRFLRDALERDPRPRFGPKFYLSAAGFLERAGDARWALDLYERLAEDFPADPGAFRALYRRGEILRRNGDARGARDALSRARSHPACVEPWPQKIQGLLTALEAAPK